MASTALRAQLGIVDSEKSPALQMTNTMAGLALTRKLTFLARSERLVVNRIVSEQRVVYRRLQARLANTQLEDARRRGDKRLEKSLLAARGAPSMNTDVGGFGDVDAALKTIVQQRPHTAVSSRPKSTGTRMPQRPTKSAPARCRREAAVVSSEKDPIIITVDASSSSSDSDDEVDFRIFDNEPAGFNVPKRAQRPMTATVTIRAPGDNTCSQDIQEKTSNKGLKSAVGRRRHSAAACESYENTAGVKLERNEENSKTRKFRRGQRPTTASVRSANRPKLGSSSGAVLIPDNNARSKRIRSARTRPLVTVIDSETDEATEVSGSEKSKSTGQSGGFLSSLMSADDNLPTRQQRPKTAKVRYSQREPTDSSDDTEEKPETSVKPTENLGACKAKEKSSKPSHRNNHSWGSFSSNHTNRYSNTDQACDIRHDHRYDDDQPSAIRHPAVPSAYECPTPGEYSEGTNQLTMSDDGSGEGDFLGSARSVISSTADGRFTDEDATEKGFKTNCKEAAAEAQREEGGIPTGKDDHNGTGGRSEVTDGTSLLTSLTNNSHQQDIMDTPLTSEDSHHDDGGTGKLARSSLGALPSPLMGYNMAEAAHTSITRHAADGMDEQCSPTVASHVGTAVSGSAPSGRRKSPTKPVSAERLSTSTIAQSETNVALESEPKNVSSMAPFQTAGTSNGPSVSPNKGPIADLSAGFSVTCVTTDTESSPITNVQPAGRDVTANTKRLNSPFSFDDSSQTIDDNGGMAIVPQRPLDGASNVSSGNIISNENEASHYDDDPIDRVWRAQHRPATASAGSVGSRPKTASATGPIHDAELWRGQRPETGVVSASGNGGISGHFVLDSHSAASVQPAQQHGPQPHKSMSLTKHRPAVGEARDDRENNSHNKHTAELLLIPTAASSQHSFRSTIRDTDDVTTAHARHHTPAVDRKSRHPPSISTRRPHNKRRSSVISATPAREATMSLGTTGRRGDGGMGDNVSGRSKPADTGVENGERRAANSSKGSSSINAGSSAILFGLHPTEVAPSLLDLHRRYIRASDYEARMRTFCDSLGPYKAPDGTITDYYYSLRAADNNKNKKNQHAELLMKSTNNSKSSLHSGTSETSTGRRIRIKSLEQDRANVLGQAPVRMRSLTLKSVIVE